MKVKIVRVIIKHERLMYKLGSKALNGFLVVSGGERCSYNTASN